MRAALVGTRWFATVPPLKTKHLRKNRINTGYSRTLIRSIFVANVARPVSCAPKPRFDLMVPGPRIGLLKTRLKNSAGESGRGSNGILGGDRLELWTASS